MIFLQAPEGSQAEVGDLIAILLEPGSDISTAVIPAVTKAGASAAPAAAPSSAPPKAASQSAPATQSSGSKPPPSGQ